MEIFRILLGVSTVLVSLVAGFVFAFAVIVMPGIRALGDKEFLRAFQVMDRVIQNNQPLFMAVWLGSVLALLATAILGAMQLSGVNRIILIGAFAIYLLGVQIPTAAINVPLNNELQTRELDTLNEAELAEAREKFEPRWIRWNTIRTFISILVTAVLVLLIFRV